MEKEYQVYVKVYHSFTVTAENEEQAYNEASETIWDDHILDCEIQIEETAQ